MFSSPWHLLLFDRLGVTIIGGKAVAYTIAACICKTKGRLCENGFILKGRVCISTVGSIVSEGRGAEGPSCP